MENKNSHFYELLKRYSKTLWLFTFLAMSVNAILLVYVFEMKSISMNYEKLVSESGKNVLDDNLYANRLIDSMFVQNNRILETHQSLISFLYCELEIIGILFCIVLVIFGIALCIFFFRKDDSIKKEERNTCIALLGQKVRLFRDIGTMNFRQENLRKEINALVLQAGLTYTINWSDLPAFAKFLNAKQNKLDLEVLKKLESLCNSYREKTLILDEYNEQLAGYKDALKELSCKSG